MGDALQKFVLLVPFNFNDGTPVPNAIILDFHEELFLLGGGFTEAGPVRGMYRMQDGSKQVDELSQLWIGIPEDAVSELEKLVSELGEKLGQESMYLERTGSKIQFIPPYEGEDI